MPKTKKPVDKTLMFLSVLLAIGLWYYVKESGTAKLEPEQAIPAAVPTQE